MQESQLAAPAPDQRSRTCIIVAGMHRSGTSATARVVNLLGADIASDLLPAVAGVNDRGFWESETTFGIHDQLLNRLGSSWDDPFPLAEGWLASGAAQWAKGLILAQINQ